MGAVDVWNTIGTWVGAVGTAGATVAALSIAIRDGRERGAARRDDEAAQARTLTVETAQQATNDMAVIHITNHGTQPFLGVYLENIVIYPGDAPPGSRQTIKNRRRAVLPPGEDYEVLVDVTTPQGRSFTFEEPYLVSGVVAHRDASGRAWRCWGSTDPQRSVPASDTVRVPPDQGHQVVEVGR